MSKFSDILVKGNIDRTSCRTNKKDTKTLVLKIVEMETVTGTGTGFGEFSNSSNITTESKIVEMETVTVNFTGNRLRRFFQDLCNTTTEPTSVEETFKWTNDEIARLIQIIFRPILVIVGTIGNGLTIYIMRRTPLKHLSTCFYMVILAFADSSK